MSKIKHQKAVSDYISNLSDADFYSFCDRLLHRVFTSAIQSCSIVDNGYTIIEDNLFIPIPAEYTSLKSIETLLPDDISQLNPKHITFISNDSFTITQDQKNNIRKDFINARIEVWGLETLKLKLSHFEHEDQLFILGDDSSFTDYLSSVQNPAEEIDIIHNIFSYIKSNSKPITEISAKKSDKYNGIIKKTKLNFSKHRSRVFDMYQLTYYHKTLVENYFQETTVHDKSEVIILREFFRSKYCSITNYPKSTYPVNDFKFLELLSDLCLEEKYKNIKKYSLWSKAIVMYFFEYCDFGARNKNDIFLSKNPDMFENLNDDIN
jgi:5-bromo-4-chloroindolyl phosphate hydrolysis protein